MPFEGPLSTHEDTIEEQRNRLVADCRSVDYPLSEELLRALDELLRVGGPDVYRKQRLEVINQIIKENIEAQKAAGRGPITKRQDEEGDGRADLDYKIAA